MEKITKASPKFKTCFINKRVRTHVKLAELKEWCRLFHENGLAPSYGKGSYGNLSFRVRRGSDEFFITVSGIELKNNLNDDFFFEVNCVDMKKKIVFGYGPKQPSSESQLHYALYKKRKDVNAVFHGHSPEILKHAKALNIPSTAREEAYGTTKLVDRVLKMVGKRTFVIMKNHGFISLGRNMKQAGSAALTMQKRALRKK